MTVPTEEEWMPLDPIDLDGCTAYKNFRGNTFDEAVQLFRNNALVYTDDLMCMSAPVFGFYLPAFMNYVMSEAGRDDCDAASRFVSLIRFHAEHHRDLLVPHWAVIEPTLKHVVEHQDDYEASWEIYGSFRAKAREIVELGFAVTFETDVPEIVPESVSIDDICSVVRTTSWPVAVQLFHHTGIDQVSSDSEKSDILRIFGPPDVSGGGDDPRFGFIPYWIIYHKLYSTIRFEFDGDSINSVSFLPPKGSTGLTSGVEKYLSPEIRDLLVQLFGAPVEEDLTDSAFHARLEAIKRFENLFRDK